ncbi:MAG: hypothetical protein QOD26_2619 [Betaproteobacteria bacterium]|jgi:hypothetical protein|nr:hypothetical protein [Betaproteobacteria bacterium]
MKAAIAVAAVPAAKTFMHYAKECSDFARLCERVRPAREYPRLLALRVPAEMVEKLRVAAQQAIGRHGVHGWLSSEGRVTAGAYDSLSLTYNPDLHDPQITNVHQSTLGSSVNREDEFYWGSTQKFAGLKNTYFDTYGFRRPTPAARTGFLARFLDQCGLSLVRSRLSIVRSGSGRRQPFAAGWHRDEPVFENLRINIPLVGSPEYRLQIEHRQAHPRPRSRSMSSHYLQPGYAYTWDTHLPHRVHEARRSTADRVHLVLGFSPWFRYDGARDAWQPNEHYGHRHPFDILCEGGLHPALRLEGA